LTRYDLVFGKEQINPAQEIYDVAKIVIDVYLTEEQKLPFTEPNSGYKRRIEKAMNYLAKDNRNKELLEGFKDAVNAYNKALGVLIQDGSLAKNLDDIHHLPSEMIKLILRQVYDRAVSPQVDILKNKKDNKDNTYGELLFQFVSEIFEETSLKSDQVFVDLGSGVGNVVLQAALEIGCESWGCEVMPNACELADAQEKEFAARCRLWGIETGKVRMERGDFRENPAIIKAIGKADVILVNNEVFGSDLNQDLINLFLTEVKNGCKIVSLKSFVPADHKITSRNQENPVNVLDVVQKYYSEDYVSWKHDSGEYYIATKDDTRVRRLLKRLE
jgi:H3 lysine-79-specific histone-lysine N-methyltransferase